MKRLGTRGWELGFILSWPPICLQIQKPVVNTDMEKLAQELEGLAQSQVKREQGPHWAGSSQGEALAVGEGGSGWTAEGMRAEAGD